MLDHLKQCNYELNIKSVSDNSFNKYGKVISGFDFSECIDLMKNRSIPDTGNVYIPCDDELQKTPLCKALSESFYGGMPVQIGYCNGNSSKLNALEYHKCSEIDVAVTDMVLILADIRDIRENILPVPSTEIFYLPAGTAVELYGTTLHFAPCKVTDEGFKSIIVLTEGTNSPLKSLPDPLCDEDKLLWMRNKWLIAHQDSIQASKGAIVGIIGDNIEIKY